jgi:hypothetical protein
MIKDVHAHAHASQPTHIHKAHMSPPTPQPRTQLAFLPGTLEWLARCAVPLTLLSTGMWLSGQQQAKAQAQQAQQQQAQHQGQGQYQQRVLAAASRSRAHSPAALAGGAMLGSATARSVGACSILRSFGGGLKHCENMSFKDLLSLGLPGMQQHTCIACWDYTARSMLELFPVNVGSHVVV